jgi:FtsH-binding integral membrane protein
VSIILIEAPFLPFFTLFYLLTKKIFILFLEYILATVDLYLDVINLFVAIIAIIGGSDR